MLVPIHAKYQYPYGYHRTSMEPHTCLTINFDPIQVALNIGTHTSMVRVQYWYGYRIRKTHVQTKILCVHIFKTKTIRVWLP